MSLIDSLDSFKKEKVLKLKDIPVIFLSYDEPNADENFNYLKSNHPNPKLIHRVHGVKGFDAAHKAAADAAGTERFFTIDADCKVDPTIWKKTVELTKDIEHATLSWSSRNIVNGLVYGNGGVKLWYSEHVKNMRSHEIADDDDAQHNVDFCWNADQYKQMNNTYGVVYNNSNSKQAFRAGFREGIKMGLDQGHKVAIEDFKHKMYPANFARWLIWMTVGRDVENGEWVIFGARLAAYMLYLDPEFDHTLITDYDWFKEFWAEQLIDTNYGEFLDARNNKLLVDLRSKLELPLVELDENQSIWFKHVHISPGKGLGWPTLLNQSALPLYGFTLPS
jgi:hypothetical protein